MAADGQTSATGTLLGMAGSAAIPSFAFVGSSSSGLYSLGNGTDIAFTLGGVQAATLTKSAGLTINGALGASGSGTFGGALTTSSVLTFLGELICNGVNVQSGTSYTVSATDFCISFTDSSQTVLVTLPSAALSNGRILLFTTLYDNGILIRSSVNNSVKKTDGSIGTTIIDQSTSLTASMTPGVWAILISNGTQWQVVGGF